MNFTKEDIQQIETKGLTVEKVKSQIELFKKGIPFTNLVAVATIDNGIKSPRWNSPSIPRRPTTSPRR